MATFSRKTDVTIGFFAESVVKDSYIMIMYIVRKCVVSTIKKMSERCPLQPAVARNAVIFNPEIMLENTERNLQKKFKSLSQHLVSLRIISSHKRDKALIQHGNVKKYH